MDSQHQIPTTARLLGGLTASLTGITGHIGDGFCERPGNPALSLVAEIEPGKFLHTVLSGQGVFIYAGDTGVVIPLSELHALALRHEPKLGEGKLVEVIENVVKLDVPPANPS